MSISPPIHFSSDLETINDDEHETIAGLNQQFDVIMQKTAEDYGHAVRSVHAKSHGIIEAEMTIADGLRLNWPGYVRDARVHKVSCAYRRMRATFSPSRLSAARFWP